MIVASCYYGNLSPDVINAQKHVLMTMVMNTDIGYVHYKTHDHATGMTELTRSLSKSHPDESILWLDVDCIPTDKASLALANNGKFHGCAQRANHIENDKHIYVSPFMMHLPLSVYRDMGEPSFSATYRGDVGEELTYLYAELVAKGKYKPAVMAMPTECVDPMWDLFDGSGFGIGTTYTNGFYHNFCIREPRMAQLFIDKCAQVCSTK